MRARAPLGLEGPKKEKRDFLVGLSWSRLGWTTAGASYRRSSLCRCWRLSMMPGHEVSRGYSNVWRPIGTYLSDASRCAEHPTLRACRIPRGARSRPILGSRL